MSKRGKFITFEGIDGASSLFGANRKLHVDIFACAKM